MQPVQEHSCVMVSAPNIAVARKIASVALTGRLVACANIIPKVESHYWWQGQIESSSEVPKWQLRRTSGRAPLLAGTAPPPLRPLCPESLDLDPADQI